MDLIENWNCNLPLALKCVVFSGSVGIQCHSLPFHWSFSLMWFKNMAPLKNTPLFNIIYQALWPHIRLTCPAKSQVRNSTVPKEPLSARCPMSMPTVDRGSPSRVTPTWCGSSRWVKCCGGQNTLWWQQFVLARQIMNELSDIAARNACMTNYKLCE